MQRHQVEAPAKLGGLGGAAGALLFGKYELFGTTLATPTVGASGALFGILGAALVYERQRHYVLGGAALSIIVLNLVLSFTISGISVGGHLGDAPLAPGQLVAQGLDRAGNVTPADAGGVTCATVVAETKHCVANVFATFLDTVGSIYANGLAVATRLGQADDPRARNLADWLMFWQWPDGGWNCDRHRHVIHSSFYESVTPMWALSAFATATGDRAAAAAAGRAAEFFLAHEVFKSHTTGQPGDPKWLKLRYPEYWHYDYLHGLVMLDRAGALADKRTGDALAVLREQQQSDGTWHLDGPQYWKGKAGQYGDAAGWDKTSGSQMLTLNALRVLKSAGA